LSDDDDMELDDTEPEPDDDDIIDAEKAPPPPPPPALPLYWARRGLYEGLLLAAPGDGDGPNRIDDGDCRPEDACEPLDGCSRWCCNDELRKRWPGPRWCCCAMLDVAPEPAATLDDGTSALPLLPGTTKPRDGGAASRS